MSQTLPKIIASLSFLYAMILGLLFFPAAHYLIELGHALMLQWVIVALLLSAINLWMRNWLWAALIMGLSVGHVYRISPYYPFKKGPQPFKNGLVVVQANVWHDNPEWPAAIDKLAQFEADFISIQEFNSAWQATVNDKLGANYPFNITLPHDSCCYGIGLFSRHRFQYSETFIWGSAPTIRAVAVTPVGKVVVYAVHTRPPVFPNETALRDALLDSLAQSIKLELFPVIVVGDLNIVPWDTKYKRLLLTAELDDARFGFHATYPMDFGLPLIPIDHVATTQLRSCGFHSFTIPGSDHKGLAVRLGTK